MSNKYRVKNNEDIKNTISMLDEKLYEYNSNQIRKHNGSLFSRHISSSDGNLIAGIAGWTWAGVCEITHLWIDEAERGNGLGKKLLLAAEKEAKKKKCTAILVRSHSFQAPFFYEKNGYKIVYILDDFPKGYKYYTLIKKF